MTKHNAWPYGGDMTNSATTITKTQATKIARKVLAGGYFDGGGEIHQRCPECSATISVPKIMGQTKMADLRDAIVDHLYFGDCES